jgi:hypothetical protein
MIKRNIVFVIVSILIFGFMGSPIAVHASSEKPRTLSEWILSLPADMRSQVDGIFERSLTVKNNETGFAPGYNEWLDNIHRDLQPVLTPAQFEEFSKLWNRGKADGKSPEPFSGIRTSCGRCCDAEYQLDWANNFVGLALLGYHPEIYCDFGIYPDNIYSCMLAADYRVGQAYSKAGAACDNCGCSDASDALYQAQNAKRFVDCALENTERFCDYNNAGWYTSLSYASSSLDAAINLLNQCIDQVCN